MGHMQKLRQTDDAPVIIVDNEGMVIFINQKFTEVYGWQEADLLGNSMLKIIPKNLHDAHNLGFSRFLLTEKTKILETSLDLPALKSDNTEVISTHCIYAEKVDDNWQFGATMHLKEG